jgi:hypothetical protein
MYEKLGVVTIQNIPEQSTVPIFRVKMKMGVAGSSETLATIYQTTRYHNPHDHNLGSTLMTEAPGSSKTLVTTYQNSWSHTTKGHNLIPILRLGNAVSSEMLETIYQTSKPLDHNLNKKMAEHINNFYMI